MKILIFILKSLLERKVLLCTRWILQRNTLILMRITEASCVEAFKIIIYSKNDQI